MPDDDDEDRVLTGPLGGHTREREGLNYLVEAVEAVYGTSCLPIHYIDTFTLTRNIAICAFITM